MTYTGLNPEVILGGITCEHCGYRIVQNQVALVAKRDQEVITTCILVPVHSACKGAYYADRNEK